ncbi:ATP-binding protein [Haliscomenobacter sp.]|uniref:ATP-binding protein n=1 Tax=Haliscomenobacter sp. TaxID=2717303 RepID=UPI0033651E81
MRSVVESIPAKARVLFGIGNIYEENNLFKEAVYYFEKTAKLPNVKKHVGPIFWYNLTSSLGMDHREMGNFIEAEQWFKEADLISEKNNLKFTGVYINLFELYTNMNEFKKAEASALKYLAVAKDLQEPRQIGNSYYLLGRFDLLNNDNITAKSNYLKALKWFQKAKDSTLICFMLSQLGDFAFSLKNYDEAKMYYQKSIQDKDKNHAYNMPYSLTGLALIESAQGHPQVALTKLNQVLLLFKKSGDKNGETQCLKSIAEVQRQLNQNPAALKNVLLAKELAASVQNKRNVIQLSQLLPELYASNQMYKDAFYSAQQYQKIADSLYFSLQQFNRKFALKSQEMEYKGQLQQQALKNQYIQAAANRNLIGMVLFGAIGVILFLFYRNRTLHSEKASLVLREEARKKNEELRAFNHTIGHDLKSPVENMQMLLQQFSLKFADKLDQESSLYLQKIEELNQDARLMIEGLLKYAEQDQLPIQTGVFETQRIVTFITQTLRDANPDKNIVFKLNQLVDQLGDPLMLRQVFVNLLQNAVKFSSTQNPIVIEVSAVQKNTEREYCIKDNGVGFPPGPTERIFELFKTVHERASFSGSGIGLAIVKRIIERHGGRIWAESNPEGGAIFRFTLPVS